MDERGKKMKRYRLNKKKFTDFLAGIACAAIAMGIWMTFLLQL